MTDKSLRVQKYKNNVSYKQFSYTFFIYWLKSIFSVRVTKNPYFIWNKGRISMNWAKINDLFPSNNDKGTLI